MFTGDQIVERASALKEKFGLAQKNDQDSGEALRASLLKGMLAGLVGGIVGTAVKTIAEKVYPPRVQGEPEPPVVLADKVSGHSLEGNSKLVASEAIHWGFGALTGAAYGALAEFYPAATSKEGASFGVTLMGLTHEAALPALGLSADADHQSSREHTSELVTHVLFGVTTELVRSLVRKLLR